MKALIIFLILSCLLVSCSPKMVESTQIEARKEIYYIVGDKRPFTGKSFSKYDNGKISSEVEYKKGIIQEHKLYRYEGSLMLHASIKSDGSSESKLYDEDGKHFGTTIYKDGVIQTKIRYNDDGSIREKIQY